MVLGDSGALEEHQACSGTRALLAEPPAAPLTPSAHKVPGQGDCKYPPDPSQAQDVQADRLAQDGTLRGGGTAVWDSEGPPLWP